MKEDEQSSKKSHFFLFLLDKPTQKIIFNIIRNARNLQPKKNIRKIRNYSRKSKSLEELSRKFLLLFINQSEQMVSLDEVTLKLGNIFICSIPCFQYI